VYFARLLPAMADSPDTLLQRLQELTVEDPAAGYRALHAKLKKEEDFKDVSLKKVQTAIQKLRSDASLLPAIPALFSASDDGFLCEWSSHGAPLRAFQGTGGMQCVEITEDLVIAGDSSGLMRMWSRTSGEHVRDVQVAQRYVKALAISGDSVFTGDYANLVQQWNLATGQREAVFTGHKAGIVSLAVSGDYIISGGGDGAVLLFDRRTAKAINVESSEVTAEPAALLYKANGFVCSLVLTDDRLLLPDRDEHKAVSIRLFTHTGDLVPENIRDKRTYKCGMPVWQVASVGMFIYGLCRDFTVKKFAAGSRQLLLTISVKAIAKEAKNPYAMKVSPERIFVGYISSGEIGIFSTEDGRRQMEKAFVGHQGTVNSFCLV